MLCKKLFWILLAAPFLLVLLIGCSSNEENPITPTPKSEPPEFKLKEFSFPQVMLNSTNNMAKMAIDIAKDAVDLSGTGAIFVAPDNATALTESKTAWEYTWSETGLTKRLAITLISGQHKWQVYYTGTANNVTFDNWRFMDVVQKTDQSNGHIYLYRDNTQQIVREWVWYTLNNEYKFIAQNYGDTKSKVEISIKADKSGKIESYVPGPTGGLVYDARMSWDALGAGMWWTYENGVQTATGTW